MARGAVDREEFVFGARSCRWLRCEVDCWGNVGIGMREFST